MGMTQDELERQQVRQQSQSTRTENSQATRTEEGKSTTGEQGTTRTEYENLDPVELMRRGRQAYVDDYIQARGGYPTLEETLGVDPQRLEEYRKRQEKLNEFKRKEAMWYNGLSVLGDVLTGAFGGNVWQRTPGKDAENARKANEQIELDRMNDAAKVNQARRAIQEEANKSWESLISKYMSTYKPSSTRTTEANREQNTTSRVNTTGNNTQNITENGTKDAPMTTGSGSGKGNAGYVTIRYKGEPRMMTKANYELLKSALREKVAQEEGRMRKELGEDNKDATALGKYLQDNGMINVKYDNEGTPLYVDVVNDTDYDMLARLIGDTPFNGFNPTEWDEFMEKLLIPGGSSFSAQANKEQPANRWGQYKVAK